MSPPRELLRITISVVIPKKVILVFRRMYARVRRVLSKLRRALLILLRIV